MIASFWQHALELRRLLLYSFSIFFFFFLLSLTFSSSFTPYLSPKKEGALSPFKQEVVVLENRGHRDELYSLKEGEVLLATEKSIRKRAKDYIVKPGGFVKLERRVEERPLFLLSPLEGLFATLKLSLFSAAALSLPAWLYLLIQFTLPALKGREKKVLFSLLCTTLLAALFSLFLTVFIIAPKVDLFLKSGFDSIATAHWSLASYLDLLFLLLFVSFIVLEIGLATLLLVHFRLLPSALLEAQRRFVWTFAFIFGALTTPPDILSQLLVAIPLIGFFELAIFYGKLRRPFDVEEIVPASIF